MKRLAVFCSAVVTSTLFVFASSGHVDMGARRFVPTDNLLRSASEFLLAQVPGVEAPGQPVSPQDAQRPAPNPPNRDPVAPRYEPPPPQIPHPNSSPVGSVRG
jgi:hypothetical protein